MTRSATRRQVGGWRLSSLLVGLACSLGCSESGAQEPAPERSGRLTLRADERDTRALEPIPTFKFLPGDEQVHFEWDGAETLVVKPSEDGRNAWNLVATAPTFLRWSHRMPARDCQRIEVTVQASNSPQFGLNLFGATRRLEKASVANRIKGGKTPPGYQTLVFDVTGSQYDEREVVFLELGIAPIAPTRVRLISIEGFHVPTWAALAPSDAEAQFARVGDDERRAFGLSSRTPQRAVCMPEEDAVLSFSIAVPDAIARQPGVLAVELEITPDSGKRIVTQYPLPERSPEAGRWTDVRVPLHDQAGQRVELAWRLKSSPSNDDAQCALTPPFLGVPSAKPPTVLLVTSDTHRADHVSGAGLLAEVKTPEIDRLMSRGLWFSNCLSTTNVTTPSHVAILTGTSPRDTRIIDNITALAPDAMTIAERFRDAGWLTWAAVSADHLDDVHSGLGQGFDRISAPLEVQRKAHDTLTRVEGWLDTEVGRPVFLWVHVFDAHTPYTPDPEFLAEHWDSARDPFDPALPEVDVPDVVKPWMPPGLRDLDYMHALYSAEVTELDAELPRLFDHPRLADGVIAFTADHGESLGSHGVFWDHGELYPQTTHVPLVLSWPGGPRGVRSDRPVSNVDLARTLLDLAGLETAEFPGHSLADESEGAAGPRFLLSSGGTSAAIQHDGWLALMKLKLSAVWIGGNCVETGKLHELELYDLAADPNCDNDLADLEPKRAARMRAALVSWLGAARVGGWAGAATRDEQTLNGLRALGYATDETDVSSAWFDPDCACPQCAKYRR
ncbi:MAG: sulfatase [Planctomycetes bacterium]|nr:sulfatase [Planctomycetota bacterium]